MCRSRETNYFLGVLVDNKHDRKWRCPFDLLYPEELNLISDYCIDVHNMCLLNGISGALLLFVQRYKAL